MLTGAVTVLNILLFCLSLTLLYLAKRPSQPPLKRDEISDRDMKNKILNIYQTVAAKIGRIRNMNLFAAKKIEGATEVRSGSFQALWNALRPQEPIP
jgi:hypothetical protein